MALKAMGLRTKRAVDFRDGYDFLVEDGVRIAVRYAIPTSDRQQVYRKRNGEVSHYSYKRWTFNFHRHGKLDERYCDFFVCFLASPSANGRGGSDVTVFVIPWEAITGLTFCSSLREGSRRPYRGKYAVYQDAWELIEKAARGDDHDAAVVAPRKSLKISTDSRRRLRLITGEVSAQGVEPQTGGDDAGQRGIAEAGVPEAAEPEPTLAPQTSATARPALSQPHSFLRPIE